MVEKIITPGNQTAFRYNIGNGYWAYVPEQKDFRKGLKVGIRPGVDDDIEMTEQQAQEARSMDITNTIHITENQDPAHLTVELLKDRLVINKFVDYSQERILAFK